MMKLPAGSLISNTCNFFEEDSLSSLCVNILRLCWDILHIYHWKNITMGCQGLEGMKETCTCMLLHIYVIDTEFIKCEPVLTLAFFLLVYYMKFFELWKSADHFFADFFGGQRTDSSKWTLTSAYFFGFWLYCMADTEPARDLSQSQTGLHYCNTRQSSLIFCHACGCFVLYCEITCSKGLLDGEWMSIKSNVRTC
jgi:hypothetical protein